MYMERIEVPAPLSRSATAGRVMLGIAVVALFVPYVMLRIALSGLGAATVAAAHGLLAVGDTTMRELRTRR